MNKEAAQIKIITERVTGLLNADRPKLNEHDNFFNCGFESALEIVIGIIEETTADEYIETLRADLENTKTIAENIRDGKLKTSLEKGIERNERFISYLNNTDHKQ